MTVSQIRSRKEIEYVKSALAVLNIEYATPAHAEADFRSKENRIYALKKDNVPVAICSIVPDKKYNYNAVKRLVVLDPSKKGNGYAKRLVGTIINRRSADYGCTPWEDNEPMKKLLASLGFVYQYNFNQVWTFWKKSA